MDNGAGYIKEAYYHGEGRVQLKSGTSRYQYKISDYLGDLMVFFEDKHEDGIIMTESMTTNLDSLEVFQRQLYYPFGLNFEGIWDHDFEPAIPENDYLYNGKELDTETGSNWSFYGFRMYDATIGRFTGVDPISDRFAWASTYNYAENSPIRHIDLHGLQMMAADIAQRHYQEGLVGQGPLAGRVSRGDLMDLYEAQFYGGAVGAGVMATSGANLK